MFWYIVGQAKVERGASVLQATTLVPLHSNVRGWKTLIQNVFLPKSERTSESERDGEEGGGVRE